MSIFETKPTKQSNEKAKVALKAYEWEIAHLTRFIEQTKVLLKSLEGRKVECIEQAKALLKSLEDRKAELEKQIS
ncbi:MAG: hypothetical protein OXI61_18920 [Candidatus Poribacteria bacterium]|nr:hypothetical protein [Candidatus Poribacteria bacterium]